MQYDIGAGVDIDKTNTDQQREIIRPTRDEVKATDVPNADVTCSEVNLFQNILKQY